MEHHVEHCSWCQATLSAAHSLRSTRLGKHERRLLLDAPPPDSEPAPIFPSGPSHNDRTATRRAKRNLVKSRLLAVGNEKIRITAEDDALLLRSFHRKYMVLEQATRTILGDEVVAVFKQELQAPGARIRWLAANIDQIQHGALRRCPNL